MLSADITGAFDRVVPVRLLHNLRKDVSPNGLLNSFLLFFLTDQLVCVFLASLLLLFCLSNALPKALLSLPLFSSSTMLI